MISDRFPEFRSLGLPDGTVLDGEIVIAAIGLPGAARRPGVDAIAPFADLQKRIGRKTLSAKMLVELPAMLIAYDLLEWEGRDLRTAPQRERRQLLEQLVNTHAGPVLQLAPQIVASDWAVLASLRESSRERGVEGMMLKAVDAHYGIGRTKNVGTWWKWKINPYTIDVVLIYAQAGHGRRASLYTDYTFALWDEIDGERCLVPFAKAYSGLSDAEIARIDNAIRKTTVEKFGPVRSVKPTMVFEIGFEGIALSSRHKAGIAVRFPRILRIRDDKPVEQADTLDALKAMLPTRGPSDAAIA